ncbi:NACHT domain-containing protein [Piscibacillus sp. B03]|uniref:NACHT domain-containing protein n=1 Tax=Piscibacillus sp. B03 TaxID=3457430 RepID=UPI003FCE7099
MPVGIDGNGFSNLIIKFAGKQLFEKIIGGQNKTHIDKKFEEAIDTAADRVQKKYPDAFGGSIDILFSEPSIFEELTRVLFRTTKVNIDKIKEEFDLSTLPDNIIEEFIYELKTELSTYHEFERIFSDTEMHDKIYEIGINLNDALTKSNLNYEDFLEEYKNTLLPSFKKINYFGLGLSPSVKRGEKSLDDIYVIPRFKSINDSVEKDLKSENEIKKFLNFEQNDEENAKIKDLFVDSNKHVVVLGNPGAGKSILGKYLTCSIIRDDFTYISENLKGCIPFRIELRKYLPYKKKNDANLLEYIVHVVKTDFLISYFNINNLIDILNSKNCLIIFDGLDEIFDIQDKVEVKGDIENFLSKYTNCKGLVTSRYIGYDEAKLDPKLFMEFEILNFNETQIEEYVNKWYECEVNIDEEIKREIDYLLNNIRDIDKELIENPLLLSLIVILYRNNGKLPNSKLEIYRSCTKTLVDKWDETKNLNIDIKVNNKKMSIFSFLAKWQYEHLSNKSKDKNEITNSLVLGEISRIIHMQLNLTDDHSEAIKWAEEFLEFAKNRSLYFDNDFTHKTFMEYFTAYNIFQNTDVKHKPQKRNTIIKKYINNAYWFIVLELLINMIDENQADNEIIDDLIIEQTNYQDESYVFFLEIINTLKNVSDKVVRKLFRDSIRIAIEKCNLNSNNNHLSKDIANRVTNLLSNDKFRHIIQKEYDDLYGYFEDNNDLIIKYYIFAYDVNLLQRENESLNIKFDDKLSSLKHGSINLFRRTISNINVQDIIEFKNHFGKQELYNKVIIPYREYSYFAPLLDSYLNNLLNISDQNKLMSEFDTLERNGIQKSDIIERYNLIEMQWQNENKKSKIKQVKMLL